MLVVAKQKRIGEEKQWEIGASAEYKFVDMQGHVIVEWGHSKMERIG